MMLLRTLLCTSMLTTLLLGAVPAGADDDLTRRLIDQCVGCAFPKDLHGRDLHDLRFVGSDLRDVDFSNANLSGARFVGADLAGAKFDGADLRNARFDGVRFRRTSFARAKVDGVRMSGVDLSGTAIVGADPRAFDVRPRAEVRIGVRDRAEIGTIPPLPPIPDLGPRIERALRDAERGMRRLEIERGPCTEIRLHDAAPLPPRRVSPSVPSVPALPAPPPSATSAPALPVPESSRA